MTETGVRGYFSASHYDEYGQLHGHSYVVWLWVTGCPDAIALRDELAVFLARLDHAILEHELTRAEGIAETIGEHFDAERVLVERPVEGLKAEWRPA